MGDLSVLGNAAAVPIVITITQMLKRNLKIKYGSDLIALVVALVLCFGWELYNIEETAFTELMQASLLIKIQWGINQIITGFATWLASSKIYDLGYGKKKQVKKFEKERNNLIEQHVQEKKELEDKVVELKNGNGGDYDPPKDDPEISSKLLEILEGR